MHTMDEIERLAQTTGQTFDRLQEVAAELEAELTAVKRRYMARLRRALATHVEARAALRAAVTDSPELFARPKSRAVHGVRFGWEKGKGRITWHDADGVVRLIERKLPDQVDVLIKTTKTPVRKALSQLPAQTLKSIGCEVQETDDAPFIRMVDSELQKFVDQLVADEELGRDAA